jgi:hypothetical protein
LRWLRLIGVFVCVGLVASGCSSSNDERSSAPSADPLARVSGEVTGDVSIEHRPGLVTPADEVDGVRRLTAAVDVRTDGEVTGEVEVRLPLTAEVDDDTVVFALTAENRDGPWELLPAEVDGDEVVIRSTHLSLFTAFVSLIGAVDDLVEETLEGITSDLTATADPPTCEDEDGARTEGYGVSSDTSDTVFWCLGRDRDGRFLRVVNNRRYALLVSYTDGVTDVVLDQLDMEVSGFLANLLTLDNQAMVGPSASATFRLALDEGQAAGFRTEVDGVATSFAQLQVGLETLVSVLNRFGAGAPPGSPEARSKLLKLVSDVTCVEAIGSQNVGTIIADCFDDDLLRSTFGLGAAALLSPVIAVGSLLAFLRAKLDEIGDIANERDRYGITVARAKPEPPPEPEPQTVPVPADLASLERLLAAVPDLTPSTVELGCESIDLLELDLSGSSAKVFHSHRGEDPCPGDPYEIYVEVVDGKVTRTADCAEMDQTGGCADYSVVAERWSGARVTTLAVSACNKPPDGVCIDSVSESVRR